MYLRIYCTATGDPARRPGIPQTQYSAAVEFRFNLIEEASAPSLFPSSCIIYLWDAHTVGPERPAQLPGHCVQEDDPAGYPTSPEHRMVTWQLMFIANII